MIKNRYNAARRILHWLIAFSLLFMLLTILLRQNWMNKNHVAGILLDELSALNVTLDEDQAVSIAKSIRKPMWTWHIYVGYVLIGLYALRMLLFTIKGSGFHSPLVKERSLKQKFESWTYIVFYVLLGASLVTGALVVLGHEKYKHDVEEIHILSDYWLIAFIVIQFSGILIAELIDKNQRQRLFNVPTAKKRKDYSMLQNKTRIRV